LHIIDTRANLHQPADIYDIVETVH